MKRVIVVTLLIFTVSMAMVACRHPKKLARNTFPAADTSRGGVIRDTSSAEELAKFTSAMLQGIKSNHIAFNTFSGRVRLGFEDEKRSHNNLTATIRMKKDSIIWISVSAPIVDEVIRAVITPDSLKLYNRLEKQLILRKTSDAEALLNIPFDFNTLQEMLIGNPIYLTDSIYQVVKTPSIISFSCDHTKFVSLFNVFADDFGLQQSKVMDKDNTGNQRSCELTYGDYAKAAGRKFPTTRRIFIEEKGVTKVALDFTRYDFDVPLTFPFNTPSSYKRM
ncbi:DUF4292 domain-containing protein [Chitinophaga nivalis]|uniref:DUF4292 domain-containing protein n=1 Tax=Chitinophaga nivalis TaxID=2991709 RepID=A0ABT3IWK8_9BACT|nr:DUF4292 domain-containing protein [Chitinophaga nivalis]MCW3461964.1 DUF4292 domain-containing protein [Chitinophaga nivalis]MCW3488345.1 DUF4292 domain-containing protein [Chitinophaga nivalis]